MKRLLSVLLAAAIGISTTACSSGGGAASSSASAQTSSAEDQRPYYVRDSDKVTGTITVYTTMEETQQVVLKELWSKYYPKCEMKIQADSVGTLATKIRGDQSSNADVVIGGLFQADGDTYHDILQKYTAACDKEQAYHDSNGYYTYYDVQLMCLVVNPSLRDQLGIKIEGYEDLLNPKLKGKIILADPNASSSGWRQLQTILTVMGDKFNDDKSWDYIKKLIPMSFSTTSSKDVYNLVSNGEYVAGLSYESSVKAMIKDGAPIECVYMKEGNTAMAGGAAIVKSAKNLEAAQSMMDLLSSSEFQSLRAKESSGRGSNSLCNLSDLPAAKTLNVKELDFDYLAKNKESICKNWNDLWAQLNK
ncbi:Bacterial extracellular solute-binding protein [Caprobacter fermentans]|uniref:Bacterial extracellular solute-binding protein n=1 Tax=Caproicibacter fermentans TaxID=2576756 RepID=A0A6N8I1Z4_9FIRM|nr:extracellular solute-binding protein [Caproicibacter fermentans]MVB11767.1 Bacterial extracellular solute-binding protein [Caproicibacter fermentans]